MTGEVLILGRLSDKVDVVCLMGCCLSYGK